MPILPLLLLALAAPPIEPSPPLERKLIADGGVEALGALDAVLVASGAGTAQDLEKHRKLLRREIERLVDRVEKIGGDDRTRADNLLTAMHGRGPLKRYVAGMSDLRRTLTTGEYNCLTSTALYVLAARELGLHVGAYATAGHILALAYLSTGPYYVETTSPDGTTAKTWDMPFAVQVETLERERDSRKEQERALLQEAVMAQMNGDDGVGETNVALVRHSVAEALAISERAARRLIDSAYEVDMAGLASMFFWNRSVEAILAKNPRRQLRMTRGYLATSAQSSISGGDSFGVRYLELQQVVRLIAETKGWREATRLLNSLIDANDNPRERAALRDLRARLWAARASASPSDRCPIIGEARRLDAEHPLVSALSEAATDCAP